MTVKKAHILHQKPHSRRAYRADFSAREARGPIIDQYGREIPREFLHDGPREFRFDLKSLRQGCKVAEVVHWQVQSHCERQQ